MAKTPLTPIEEAIKAIERANDALTKETSTRKMIASLKEVYAAIQAVQEEEKENDENTTRDAD